jgi:AraC family transcriptional activator of pobA
LDLPVDRLQPTAGFTILNLKDVGFELPDQSPSFRPEYFSFLFVKDGVGQYTIIMQTQKDQPYYFYI